MTFTDIIKGPQMSPVLMLCRNSLDLTKNAVRTVLEQDIPVSLYIIDNESTDGTKEWIKENRIKGWHLSPPKGVSASWNFGLDYLFATAMCEHALVINNDVELRRDTYHELLIDGGQFVTAVSVGDRAQLNWDGKSRIRMHPDFSCYMIRREVWEKVGTFDESMALYCSDLDMHIRLHRAGIEAYTIGIPFYHFASGTLKTGTEEERKRITERADKDREAFRNKWHVSAGSNEYFEMFSPSTFGVNSHVTPMAKPHEIR